MESRTSKSGTRIAAFDLDHTLLKPHGKRKFAKDRNDAELVYSEIPSKLKELRKDGYKIIIFTNQNGLGKHISIEDIYYKIDTLLPHGKEIDVYISYKHDQFRKPCLGMLNQFLEDNGAIESIFYVGDAAGRHGDHSFSDAQFAANCDIPFYTPEQFFLNKKERLPKIPHLKPPPHKPLKRVIPENTVVILIGLPASGKSTLAKQLAEKYADTTVINNDTCGSAAKSYTTFKRAVKNKALRIIVDNTNATLLTRAEYVEVAKNAGYSVYAIKVATTLKHCHHLNWYRTSVGEKQYIPDVAYHSFNKRFEPIDKREGYDHTETFVPELLPEIFTYSF